MVVILLSFLISFSATFLLCRLFSNSDRKLYQFAVISNCRRQIAHSHCHIIATTVNTQWHPEWAVGQSVFELCNVQHNASQSIRLLLMNTVLYRSLLTGKKCLDHWRKRQNFLCSTMKIKLELFTQFCWYHQTLFYLFLNLSLSHLTFSLSFLLPSSSPTTLCHH